MTGINMQTIPSEIIHIWISNCVLWNFNPQVMLHIDSLLSYNLQTDDCNTRKKIWTEGTNIWVHVGSI